MIHIYTGEWKYVPEQLKRVVEIRSFELATQKEMLDYGKSLIDRQFLSIFTNHDLVMLGVRVAIRERVRQDPLSSTSHSVRITHFNDKHPNGIDVPLDRDGNFTDADPEGFFDASLEALSYLF